MIVSEISANHMGEFDLAQKLVDESKAAGADAVKFQFYEPSDMTAPLDHDPYVLHEGPWAGKPLWELYDEAKTPREWLPELFERARRLGMVPFCSVFSPKDVPFLEELGPEVYKIASPEVEYRALWEAAARTGKHVIISDGVVGAEKAAEIAMEIEELSQKRAFVLSCVSEYPAYEDQYGFGAPENAPIDGLSDHSKSEVVWMAAAARGATIIEAHLMLSHYSYGHSLPLDYQHSLIPGHFKDNAAKAREIAKIAFREPAEPKNPEFRRRWVYSRDIKAGEVLQESDFVCLRASEGIAGLRALPDVGWGPGSAMQAMEDKAQWQSVTEEDVRFLFSRRPILEVPE